MKILRFVGLLLVLGAAALGCRQAETPNSKDKQKAEIEAAMAELSPADRKLAEAQRECPIEHAPLGSMGKPFPVEVKGQRMFLCCEGCKEKALADPEKTLATVKKLTDASKTP